MKVKTFFTTKSVKINPFLVSRKPLHLAPPQHPPSLFYKNKFQKERKLYQKTSGFVLTTYLLYFLLCILFQRKTNITFKKYKFFFFVFFPSTVDSTFLFYFSCFLNTTFPSRWVYGSSFYNHIRSLSYTLLDFSLYEKLMRPFRSNVALFFKTFFYFRYGTD